MPELEVHTALGQAYGLSEISGNRPAAVAHMRGVLADPAHKQAAQDHLSKLREVVRARTLGDRCGCHISQVAHDILSEAMTDAA